MLPTRLILLSLLTSILSACSFAPQAPLPTEGLQPASSTSILSAASTPENASTTTITSWNNVPLNLPDITIHEERAEFITLETSANLQDSRNYFRGEFTSNDWLITDDLLATKTQFDGEAVFIRFLKDNDVNCMVIGTQAGKARTTVNVAITANMCSVLRSVADQLRTNFWSLPTQETWNSLELPEMKISYPNTWAIDENEMNRQPICNSGEYQCLVYFTSQTQGSIGVLTVIKRSNSKSQTLKEIVVEEGNNLVRSMGNLQVVARDVIILSDNREAIYVARRGYAGDLPIIALTLYTLKDTELFTIQGMLIGQSEKDNELLVLLNSMILSFSPAK
jgi:hypothetical protein